MLVPTGLLRLRFGFPVAAERARGEKKVLGLGDRREPCGVTERVLRASSGLTALRVILI